MKVLEIFGLLVFDYLWVLCEKCKKVMITISIKIKKTNFKLIVLN